ncbi:hypothetical protein N1851_030239 [Merluccius polli]|uniref:Uncharacterized protein n=1 Tax=Merluccius polli TaxID=89951 RepID=A0AA47NQ86_MERPO|nr:hypothetical protein N1851_030239 [Merluccius polli]
MPDPPEYVVYTDSELDMVRTDHLHQNVQATPKYEIPTEEARLCTTKRSGKDSLQCRQPRHGDGLDRHKQLDIPSTTTPLCAKEAKDQNLAGAIRISLRLLTQDFDHFTNYACKG